MGLKDKINAWNERNKRPWQRRLENKLTTGSKPSKISETKCTCQSCGNVWYFGKTDQLENAGNAMHNLGKSLSCCTGCAPALLIKDKEVKNLKKCPKCNSKNVSCEKIIHEIK